MIRAGNRAAHELRPISLTRRYTRHPEGSVLVEFGDTRVLCTASVEDRVPAFLRGSGGGWVTAEYGMLPRATGDRSPREATRGRQGGRTLEIQRLIGRSLRAALDLSILGERTITVDCDVIQADGGTRTASVTGGFIALADAVGHLRREGAISADPIRHFIASVSVGICGGRAVLDLNHEEDSTAETDMNVVMNEEGDFVEIQGTAETTPFTGEQMFEMIDYARAGVAQLIEHQRKALAE